jgi:hypothetical protein
VGGRRTYVTTCPPAGAYAASFFVTVAGVVTAAHRVCAGSCLFVLAAGLAGCGEEGLFPTTVDPGPDFEVANIVFDENFYYCQVEPRALFAMSCGTGDPALGESAGSCHASATSFRFIPYMPPVAETCMGNVPGGVIPTEARDNYQAAQVRMRRDSESSPLLLRPMGIVTHPRQVFNSDSDAAAVIREWAMRVSTQ